MMISFLILFAVTLAVAVYTWQRHGERAIVSALRFSADEGLRLAIRLPIALFAAACLAELIPDRAIAAVMGADTGLWGILAASVVGGLLPGGPMIAFPMALILAQSGAGGAQMVALVTGWSVFAFHRVIAYEGPMMGWRFVALRFAVSAFVPPVAGILAGVAAWIIGSDLGFRR